MAAYNQYKSCVWKANGDIDCQGTEGSIAQPEPLDMYSTCLNTNCYPNKSYFSKRDENVYTRDQNGGSYPATYYPSQGPGECMGNSNNCPELSGPLIATSGFGVDAQWVSPYYHQPPHDTDNIPSNNFNHINQGGYSDLTYNYDSKTGYAPYFSMPHQRGGGSGKRIQSKISKDFYGGGFLTNQKNMYSNNPNNPYLYYKNPKQCYGGNQGANYPLTENNYNNNRPNNAAIPDGMSYKWQEDLRYRDGTDIIPAQAQYENILNNYKQGGTYGQTDMRYTNELLGGWNSILNETDQSPCCGGNYSMNRYGFKNPYQVGGSDATYDKVARPNSTDCLAPPSYSRLQCNANMIQPEAPLTHFDCQINPNLTLNIGCSYDEAFENLLSQDNAAYDIYNKYSPLIEEEWNYLKPRHAYQTGGSCGSSCGPSCGPSFSPPGYNYSCNPLTCNYPQPTVSYNADYNNNGGGYFYNDPAREQIVNRPAYLDYEIPYNKQGLAPRNIMWVPKVRDKLRILSRELGSPYLIDKNSKGFAVWNNSCLNKVYYGVFKRIELHDEVVNSELPFPHCKNVYTWVRLDVPINDLDKLQVITPNITYDMTKKWLCIGGSSLNCNLAMTTLICMYLRGELSLNQIQRYKLQKKYLRALIPQSKLYNPNAKKRFLKVVKSMCR